MRLGDLDALKEKLSGEDYQTWTHEYGYAIPTEWVMNAIDNAPTVEPCYQTTSCLDCKNYDKETHNCPRYCEIIKEAIKSRPQGECRTCRHRDPEDKKCDCGGQERLGCPFPVRDNYYCKFYEKGGKE